MWKEDFVNFLFSIDPKDLDIEGALALKFNHIPNSLYKYKSFDGNSLNLLNEDILHLSNPNDFNDPFDCSLTVSIKELGNISFLQNMDMIIGKLDSESKFTYEEKEKLKKSETIIYDLSKLFAEKYRIETITGENVEPKEFAKITSEISDKLFNEIFSNLGDDLNSKMFITCFSETNKSILMWSHYSDHHKGFCIEYDFKELGHHDLRTRLLYPVIYQNKLFDASEYIMHLISKNNKKNGEAIIISHLAADFNIFMNVYAALVKSTEWSYEKEWRYVFSLGPISDPMIVRVPKPKAVYLGAKVLEEHKNKVLKIAKKRGFDVYQMQMKKSEFALISKKL